MKNLVVAKFLDGRLLRGSTLAISPQKESFTLTTVEGENKLIFLKDLKAVFFVKSLEGQPAWKHDSPVQRQQYGMRVAIEFLDGEVIEGIAQTRRVLNEKSFFIFPVSENDNNERILVNRAATKNIRVGT